MVSPKLQFGSLGVSREDAGRAALPSPIGSVAADSDQGRRIPDAECDKAYVDFEQEMAERQRAETIAIIRKVAARYTLK